MRRTEKAICQETKRAYFCHSAALASTKLCIKDEDTFGIFFNLFYFYLSYYLFDNRTHTILQQPNINLEDNPVLTQFIDADSLLGILPPITFNIGF